MARKATKSSTVTPRNSIKRAAPDPPPSRQSKRSKAGRKSYAEPASEEENSDDVKQFVGKKEESDDGGSEFEDANDNAALSESAAEEIDGEDDDGSEPEKSTARGRGAKRAVLPSRGKKHANEEELWKDGAKLEPGKQIIIKRPKAREAGKTPYTDETIHPNTMLFLQDLRSHNDRQWLKGSNIISTTSKRIYYWISHRLTMFLQRMMPTIARRCKILLPFWRSSPTKS